MLNRVCEQRARRLSQQSATSFLSGGEVGSALGMDEGARSPLVGEECDKCKASAAKAAQLTAEVCPPHPLLCRPRWPAAGVAG